MKTPFITRFSTPISVLCLTLTLLGSCAKRINPTAPAKGEIPAPSISNQLSEITIPISYDISDIKQQAEAGVPMGQNFYGARTIIGQSPVGDIGLLWEWKRSPLVFNFTGNQLDLSAVGYYRADIEQRVRTSPIGGGHTWVHLVGCGDPNNMEAVNLGLRTTFSFKPDYRLEASTIAASIDPTTRCRVGIISYDVTNQIMGRLTNYINGRIPDLTTKFNSRLSFKAQAQKAWDALQAPIGAGNNMYLLIQPKTMGVSAINGSGNTLTTSIGLTAQPVIFVGAKPNVSPQPLPDMVNQPAGNSFNVSLLGQVSYDEATKLLANGFSGKRFPIGNDYFIDTKSVRLYGTNTKTILEVDFTASKKRGLFKPKAKGKFFFEGTPSYDPATQTLLVNNIDYTLDTKNIILKSAAWLYDRNIAQLLQAKAKFSIASKLADSKDKIQQALNRNINQNVTISGAINSLTPLGVSTNSDGIQAVMLASGSAQLTIH